MYMNGKTARLNLALISIWVGATATRAKAGGESWPQWGGKNRDFHCVGTTLADSWPSAGPKVIWKRELGDGYSAIIGDGERLYTTYAKRNQDANGKYEMNGDEVVVALEPKTGKTIWEFSYSAPWNDELDMQFGPGPHSTPLLAGDRLITIGSTALMHGIDARTGRKLWSRDLCKDYKIDLFGRGYGSSPVEYKGQILIPLGGKGQSIGAFNPSDGTLTWKGGDLDGTYASLFVAPIKGQDELILFSSKEVAGLDPTNGALIWSISHPTKYGANISTPVLGKDNLLFISSAYGMGSRGVELSPKNGKVVAKELWYNQQMKIHHGNALRLGDIVVGSSGDFGPAFLAALNARTGEMAWKERGIAKATMLSADGKLIILDEDGWLLLAEATPEKLKRISKVQVCKKNAWTVPTLMGKTLFVRDRENIQALDLG